MAGKGFWENLYYTDGAGTPCYTANLISDANKGIAMIEYDNMNQPRRIQFTNGNVTEYVYTSTGEKLRTIHRTAVDNISVPIGNTLALTAANTLSVDSTDYIGSFIFRNGKADKYLFGGGYCTFTTAGQPVYHYYTRDHLGNNRAVVNENGTLEQMTHYYPFGGVYGDAGLNASLQPYKYNGKELDRMHGLDLYDYGVRNYDAIIGRWTTMDPLAERTPEVSPYAYCKNNPVNAIDIGGDSIYYCMPNIEHGQVMNYTQYTYIQKDNTSGFYKGGELYLGNNITINTIGNALNTISNAGSIGKKLIYALSGKTTSDIQISYGRNETKYPSPNNKNILIQWNFSEDTENIGMDINGNVKEPSSIALGHELFHAIDFLDNTVDLTPWYTFGGKNIPRCEYNVSIKENELRKEMGIPLRLYYGIQYIYDNKGNVKYIPILPSRILP